VEVQALPGKYVNAVGRVACKDPKTGEQHRNQISLAVRYLRTEKGKAVEVRELGPWLETSLGKKFKIVSDLKRPRIKDGVLILALESIGEVSLTVDANLFIAVPEGQHCKFF
jgi:hypothetical protein